MSDMIPPDQLRDIRESAALFEPDGSVRGEPKIKAEQPPYREMPITSEVPEATVTAEKKSPFTDMASRVDEAKLQNTAAYERITDPRDPRIFDPNSANTWATFFRRL